MVIVGKRMHNGVITHLKVGSQDSELMSVDRVIAAIRSGTDVNVEVPEHPTMGLYLTPWGSLTTHPQGFYQPDDDAMLSQLPEVAELADTDIFIA